MLMSARSPKRLTVVQLVPALNSGGVEKGTVELAAELVRRGHRSLVISGGGRLVEPLVAAGADHIDWSIGKKSPWSLRWIPRLRKLLQEENVDLVHARSRVPAWVGYLAWRGMAPARRPRFVTTVHSLYSVSRYSKVMMKGEHVVAISQTVRRYILDNYSGVDERKIHLIHNGIDPAEFPHGFQAGKEWLLRWYSHYPQTRTTPVITLPGRLVRRKGHADFLELMSRLKQQGVEVCGLIVGGEDPNRRRYAQWIRKTIADWGLENVVLTGDRSDMRQVYSISDLVLCLSANPEEAFGRTAVEALSMGRPVVGYNRGGIGETLGAIFPQGLVELGNVDMLARRVMEFLSVKPDVPPTKLFRRQDMLDRTLELYQQLTDTSVLQPY